MVFCVIYSIVAIKEPLMGACWGELANDGVCELCDQRDEDQVGEELGPARAPVARAPVDRVGGCWASRS